MTPPPPGRWRTGLPWLALAVVVVVALVVVLAPAGGEPTDAARVDALARGLRCPTCQSESVADSRSETAAAIRADLERRVAAGEGDDEIRAAYVERYTEWVLLEPSADGFGLLVWALPVAVLVLGAGGVVAVVRRSSREARPVSAADEEIVRRARAESEPLAEPGR